MNALKRGSNEYRRIMGGTPVIPTAYDYSDCVGGIFNSGDDTQLGANSQTGATQQAAPRSPL